MKVTLHFRKGLVEKVMSNVWQSLSIFLSAKQKKILLVGVLLLHIFSASFSQKEPVFLSGYDSCQRSPRQIQTRLGIQALSSSAQVRLAYVIPSNRTAQPDAVADFQYAVKIGQQWLKEQMEQIGFGAKTFAVETEADGVTPLVHVVQVPETDDYLRGDIWGRTQTAAINAGLSIWAAGEVWVLIPEAHLMLPDGTVTGGMAGGASNGTGDSPGLAMIGSNALPLFHPGLITDDTPYDGKILPGLGPFPMKQDVTFSWFEGTTFSSLASTWLGALWHEMGHAFGALPHDFRNDDNFHGNIMGNGLRGTRGSLFPEKYPQDYTRLEYSSALILNVSHYFNSDKIVTSAPGLSFSNSGSITPENGHVKIAFQASDEDSLALAYLGYRGEIVAELVLDGTAVDTAFRVPYFTPGEINPYDFSVYDKQGNRAFSGPLDFFVPAGYNQAPAPFIRIEPPVPGLNQPVRLDASRSSDDQSITTVTASWDVDNDGQYDTSPTNNKVTEYLYQSGGNYLIRLKLVDEVGAETISTPVSVKIPGENNLAIQSFTLINADDDEAVGILQNNMVIQLAAWEGKTFSVRANTSAGGIERVEFELQGPIVHKQTERVAPYALFGDNPTGNYTGKKLLAGEYTLTATPFSSSGKGMALTASFRVIDTDVPTLTLMNAYTEQEIKELKNGDVIRLAEAGRFLDVRANITAANITQVDFDLKGPISHHQTERVAPYALFGDLQGNFNGRYLLPGAYTLTVTPYINEAKTSSLTVSFTVTDGFAITGFTLIDATLDQPIGALAEGDVIDLSLLKDHKLAVRADSDPIHLDKVDLTLQGPVVYSSTERVFPYALFGDVTQNGSTDYTGAKMFPGNYTLVATPYSGGFKGTAHAITFTVISGGTAYRQVDVYPIPSSDVINIKHEGNTTAHITLLDFSGNVVLDRPLSPGSFEQLDIKGLAKGIHYLKVVGPKGVEIIRVVIE